MARTRRQVTLQQESGVPASPPQSLPNAPRPARARRTAAPNNNNDNNSNTPAAPTNPTTSTRGGPAARGGRIGKAKRVGRGRIQRPATMVHAAQESSGTDVEGNEASDSLTQTETAVQATPAARNISDDHEETEDREETNVEPSGETQSPTSVSAHPVQVQDETAQSAQVQDVTADPIADPVQIQDVPADPIADSVQVQDVLEDPIADSVQVQDVPADPVHGSTMQQERLESATSLTFREILSSSPRSPGLSPTLPAPKAVTPTSPCTPNPKPSFKPPSPASVSSLPSSPLVKPAPQAPTHASPRQIYFMPSNPEYSHSVISIRMDYFQGSKDPVRPSEPAAFAVPSELVAPICRFIESRAKPGSDLSKVTTDHPAVNAMVHGNAKYRPQLPSWQSQQSAPLPSSTMKLAFLRKVQRKRGLREMEEGTVILKTENAKLKAIASGELTEPPPKRTKTVPDPWTSDGQLLLGRTKEIEVDEHGEALDPLEVPSLSWSKSCQILWPGNFPVLTQSVDDTMARKRAQEESEKAQRLVGDSPYVEEEISDNEEPALGGLFEGSQDQVQPEQVPETPRARRWGLPSFLPSARSVTKYIPFSSGRMPSTPPQQPPQPEQLTRTEPQVNATTAQSQSEPERADTVAGPRHRHRQSTSNQQKLLTKQQSAEDKRIKKERAILRREAEALQKAMRDFEMTKKDYAEQQKSADVAQTPGQKRKRIPSPDTIPLPAGGGFGMVDEYFVVDSSSDEELGTQETPTKQRPSKKARTSSPHDATVGSPFRARPYTGTLFAHPDAQRSPDENVFSESNKPGANSALDSTPPPGPTLTFKVPSPGSSDSDEEDDEQEQIIERPQKVPSPSALAPKSILRNSASNQSQSRPAANSISPSKSMVPPPRPNPVHATLPAATTMPPSGALEKAREKALKHQPKQPSTLRESSRLSSSTVNSDLGDEEEVEGYDPANPAIILSPSKAPALGQRVPPASVAFGQPAVGPTAPTAIQEPVPQAVSEQSAFSHTAPTATTAFQQPVTQAVSEQPAISHTVSTDFQQPVTQAVSQQPREQQAVSKSSGEQAETINDHSARADDLPSSGQAAVASEGPRMIPTDSEQSTVNTDQKIQNDLDRWWKEHGDECVLREGYEDFEKDMLAEEQELMDVPNGDPYIQPRNIISAALDRIGANGLSDRGIKMDIEDNWRPGDLERTESNPENGMRVFFNRLVKNGVIEKDLADRVVATGVPPGITEYLAGQEVMGPVTA